MCWRHAARRARGFLAACESRMEKRARRLARKLRHDFFRTCGCLNAIEAAPDGRALWRVGAKRAFGKMAGVCVERMRGREVSAADQSKVAQNHVFSVTKAAGRTCLAIVERRFAGAGGTAGESEAR